MFLQIPLVPSPPADYNASMKSFHIITFGCQMNEHDSERMTGILKDRAFAVASGPYDADIIILNTCSIREKAEQKFYSELGRLRKLKEENPKLTIAVAGCIAQQEGRGILARAPYVDMIFGPSDISGLSDIIDRSRLPLSCHSSGILLFPKQIKYIFIGSLGDYRFNNH